MDLKPGYKRTEMGFLPDDWEVRRLDEHFRIYAGGDVPKHSLSQTQSESHPFPIFANSIQGGGLYGYTNAPRSKSDSLTITARGYLGHAEYRNHPFYPIGRLLVLEPIGLLDARFTCYVVNGRIEFAIESTGVPQLTAPQVGKYSVAAPPTIREQRAIAAALSDVDALLDGLDRLIAKKRDLKQGAMQQLLTGRTRLPGFHGKWETLPARAIGVFKGGCGFPLSAQGEISGEYPFFKVSDMNNEGNETFMTTANHYISEQTRKRLGATVLPAASIVFAKVGAAVFLERKKILGQASCIDNNMAAFVLDRSRADVGYVHALLLNTRLSALVATTALPALNGKQLGEMPLAVPPLPEQTAIAAILSDMEAEISTLEARLEKTRDLKQAMMQELLTGKTRLIPAGAAHA